MPGTLRDMAATMRRVEDRANRMLAQVQIRMNEVPPERIDDFVSEVEAIVSELRPRVAKICRLIDAADELLDTVEGAAGKLDANKDGKISMADLWPLLLNCFKGKD